MKKGKFKKVTVPATTENQTKAIVNFLLSEGHSASRINTTGVYDVEKQFFRKTGGRVGHSDISGSFKCHINNGYNFKVGLAFFIEGKFSKDDKLSDDQIEFRNEVESTGAFYLECENLDQFYAWYEEVKQNIKLTFNGEFRK